MVLAKPLGHFLGSLMMATSLFAFASEGSNPITHSPKTEMASPTSASSNPNIQKNLDDNKSSEHAKHEFQPATFRDGRWSLQENIKFPKVEVDLDLTILCKSFVSIKGRFEGNYCYGGEELDNFTRAIGKAVKKSRVTPAVLDGQKVGIWLNYSVLFYQVEQKTKTLVFPHHFHNAPELGFGYSAPQRLGVSRSTYCDRPINLWISTMVNKDGVAGTLTITDDKTLHDCEHRAIDVVAESQFVPAYHNGSAVDATHIERLFSFIQRRQDPNSPFGERRFGRPRHDEKQVWDR